MPFGGLLTAGAIGLGVGGALAGGGGSGGGSGPTGPLNAASPLLDQLLGAHRGRKGDVFPNRKNPGGIFGPDFGQQLHDFIYNPTPTFTGEQGIVGNLLGGNHPQQILDSTLQQLAGLQGQLGEGSNLALDLSRTGGPVDATPLYQTAIDQFRREVLPAVAERAGAFGGGLQSQGFLDTAGREGANLLDEAARQNVALADAAQQRRLGALGLLGSLSGQQAALSSARAALPFGVAQDALGLGTAYRNIIDTQKARPLSVFSQLAGLGGPGTSTFLQQGYNPQGSGTADILSSLSSNAGGIASLLQLLKGPGSAVPAAAGAAIAV